MPFTPIDFTSNYKFRAPSLGSIGLPPMSPGDSINDYQPKINPFALGGGYEPRQIETPAFDAYRNFLSTYPTAQKSNIWQKIADAAAGASSAYFKGPDAGLSTVRGLQDNRRNRQLEDWGNQLEPMRQAATIESNNLGRVNSADRNTITSQYNQGRLAVANKNADTARAKLEQGNYTYIGMTEQGNPIVINKTNGMHTVLTDVDMFSDAEKVNKQLDAAMARVNANNKAAMERTDKTIAGANSRTAATIAGNERMNNARIEGAKARNQADIDAAAARLETQIAAGSTKTGKPNAALLAYQQQGKLAELATKYPDYIKTTSTGKFVIVPPTGYFSGEAENIEYNQLISELNQGLPNITAAPTTTTTSKPKPTTGVVKMVDQNGQEYNIPAAQVAAAMKDGLRRK